MWMMLKKHYAELIRWRATPVWHTATQETYRNIFFMFGVWEEASIVLHEENFPTNPTKIFLIYTVYIYVFTIPIRETQ